MGTITHPFRVAEFRIDDPDSLAVGLTMIADEIRTLQECERLLRQAAGNLATGEQKTQRVVGTHVVLKVTRPDLCWSQSALKQIVSAYDPSYWQPYLRIATWAVNLREFKKLLTATGHERFERFKASLQLASSVSTSPPRVEVQQREEIRAGVDEVTGPDFDAEDGNEEQEAS